MEDWIISESKVATKHVDEDARFRRHFQSNMLCKMWKSVQDKSECDMPGIEAQKSKK